MGDKNDKREPTTTPNMEKQTNITHNQQNNIKSNILKQHYPPTKLYEKQNNHNIKGIKSNIIAKPNNQS